MKTGDLVRFRNKYHGRLTNDGKEIYSDWEIGLLIEYHTWEKIATILLGTETVRIAARDVQLVKRSKRRIKP